MLLAIYILAYLAVGLWSGIICLRTIFKNEKGRGYIALIFLLAWPVLLIQGLAWGIGHTFELLGRLIADFADRNDK